MSSEGSRVGHPKCRWHAGIRRKDNILWGEGRPNNPANRTHVSQTAALLAFNATASVARASTPSACARKYALCAAARAATMMHFALSDGPPTTLPMIGAGNTEYANDHHRSVLDRDDFLVISTDDSHVRPTELRFENRRTPTLIARVANPRVSSRARLDTAAARTLISGQSR